jgi:hypothetical protein
MAVGLVLRRDKPLNAAGKAPTCVGVDQTSAAGAPANAAATQCPRLRCERPRYPTGEYPAPGLSRPPRNSGAVPTYRLNLIVLAYYRVVAASGGKPPPT